MLKITVQRDDVEAFNESTQTFLTIPGIKPTEICLEHSLVSIAKWEAKWHVPFLDEKREKTPEQALDYIKCMTITQNVSDDVYNALSQENMDEIQAYIEDPMTATWFSGFSNKKKNKKKVPTAEVIYCQMIQWNIPIKFEKWHINRLMTLIRVCSIEMGQPDKMSKKEVAAEYARINAERRAKMKSKG